MSAESARAKRIDRHRRGKRHAARAGRVHVLRGAPYGARSVTKEAGGGQARSAMVPDKPGWCVRCLPGSGATA